MKLNDDKTASIPSAISTPIKDKDKIAKIKRHFYSTRSHLAQTHFKMKWKVLDEEQKGIIIQKMTKTPIERQKNNHQILKINLRKLHIAKGKPLFLVAEELGISLSTAQRVLRECREDMKRENDAEYKNESETLRQDLKQRYLERVAGLNEIIDGGKNELAKVIAHKTLNDNDKTYVQIMQSLGVLRDDSQTLADLIIELNSSETIKPTINKTVDKNNVIDVTPLPPSDKS